MKRRVHASKKTRTTWALLSVLIVVLGFLAYGEFRRWYGIYGEIERAEGEIVDTEQRINELSHELSLVADPQYAEKEVRQNLNVKRQGEEVLVVVGLNEAKREENFSLASPAVIEEGSEMWENVKDWWAYFFK
jgi:hypothetical protein